jgi:hypothetical protein
MEQKNNVPIQNSNDQTTIKKSNTKLFQKIERNKTTIVNVNYLGVKIKDNFFFLKIILLSFYLDHRRKTKWQEYKHQRRLRASRLWNSMH